MTNRLVRLFTVPLLFALACVLSGAYGAIHDQISYSISPEYFTKFKFAQFQVPPHFHNRLGAAAVGWQASWWMGAIIGLFLVPAGMLVRDNRGYIFAVLRSFFVVLGTTIVIGMIGLITAYLLVYGEPRGNFMFNNVIIADPIAFRRVGVLHNFSYLGGLVGIFTGLASILRSFLAENARLNEQLNSSR